MNVHNTTQMLLDRYGEQPGFDEVSNAEIGYNYWVFQQEIQGEV